MFFMFQGLTGHHNMPVTRLLQCQCQGTTKMDRTEAGRSEDCTSTDCAGRTRMQTGQRNRLHPLEANTKTQRVVSKHGGVTDETQER